MSSDATDRRLHDLITANERIKDSLLELELDPTRELLDGSALAGETASAWATARAAIAQLWDDHAALDALLQRARRARGRRSQPRADRLSELQELLDGRSIELPERVPLEHRQLHMVPSCTPDELIARMSAAFDDVKGVLVRADRAWGRFGSRLSAAQDGLAQVALSARGLGDSAVRECDVAAARCGELIRTLVADPLGVDPADVDALECALATLSRSVAAVADLRCNLDARLRAAAGELELLQMAWRGAEDAYADAVAKVVAPTLLHPGALPAGIDRGLDQIRASANAGAWREAGDGLTRWGEQASAALEQARRVTAASRASLEVRNELRGLLDAYCGRARRLRLTEDSALEELREQARACLYVAPTDLARARELVQRYQRALAAASSAEEITR